MTLSSGQRLRVSEHEFTGFHSCVGDLGESVRQTRVIQVRRQYDCFDGEALDMSRVSQPQRVIRLSLRKGRGQMAKQAGLRTDFDHVLVTWCSCERCAALGPKSITLVRHRGREQTSVLHAECCAVRAALDRSQD